MPDTGVGMLRQALALAHREMEALADGGYDEAIDLAGRRADLTRAAWQQLEAGCNEEYRNRLTELSELQKKLTVMATQARENLRSELRDSRKQRQRMRGYHMAIGQALQ